MKTESNALAQTGALMSDGAPAAPRREAPPPAGGKQEGERQPAEKGNGPRGYNRVRRAKVGIAQRSRNSVPSVSTRRTETLRRDTRE